MAAHDEPQTTHGENAHDQNMGTGVFESPELPAEIDAEGHASADPVGRILESEFGRARYFALNPRRVTFRELMFENKLLAPLGWVVLKLRGKAIVSSTDDLAVESLLPLVEPFQSEGPVGEQVARMRQELEALGFVDIVQQCVSDSLQASSTVLWTMRSTRQPDVVARIHLRAMLYTHPASAKLFFEFITEQSAGEYVWTLSGKPDMLAPPTCRVTHRVGASAADLLAAHDKARSESASAAKSAVRPTVARDIDGALQITERLHVLVRDFHLKRGVFQPESQRESDQRRALDHTFAEAIAHKSPRAGVLLFMQMAKLGRFSGVGGKWLLLLSLAAFLALGFLWKSWTLSLMLVPVLFIHELGHFVAMKAFGYRDVKMFFLPGFGAAVAGRVDGIAAWKRVVVALAGPLPSIVIAIIMGLFGIAFKLDWATKAALLTLALNSFNLLPVLPLDGGHVANVCIFSRHVMLEIAFRAVAGAVVAFVGFALGAKILGYIGIGTLVSLPFAYKLAKLVSTLKSEGVVPPEGAETIIDIGVADRVAAGVIAAQPTVKHSRRHADASLLVYDQLRFRPPGIFASISLLFVHGAAIVISIIFLFVFTLAVQGELNQFLHGATNQGRYAVETTPSSVQSKPAAKPLPQDSSAVFATYSSEAVAASAFERLSKQASPDQAVGRFCNTVIVRSAAMSDADRTRMLAELRSESDDVFATTDTLYSTFDFTAITISKESTKQINKELSDYFALCGAKRLIPPWDANGPDQQQLAARKAFLEIRHRLDESWKDPEHKAITNQATQKLRDGDKQGEKQLWAKLREHDREFRKKRLQQFIDHPPSPIYADIARQYLATIDVDPKQDPENKLLLSLAETFGQVAESSSESDTLYAEMGYAYAANQIIFVSSVKFADPIHGPQALAAWLKSKGCIGIRYTVRQGEAYDEDSDSESDYEP